MFKFHNVSAERTDWTDKNTKLIWLPHKKTYEFASKYVEGKNVLDIGCGNGFGSYSLSKKAKKVFGVDIDKNSIEYAKKKFKRNNLVFIKNDVYNLVKERNKFEVITCFQLIEHLTQPEKLIELTKKLLEKNGILLISTPNLLSEHIPSPYHVKEYSSKEINKLLKNYFKNVKLYGLYEGNKIKTLLDKKRALNNKILKIDFLHITNLLPLSIKSKIFALGSKTVGLILKKSKTNDFEDIVTRDYKTKLGITKFASDIIGICR